MVDAKVLEAVYFFSSQFRNSGIRINNLILFGSSGTGTSTPGSDIDIAIISDDFANRDIFYRALLTKDAEMQTVKKFKIPLDVITLTTEEYQDQKSLIAGVLRKGIILPTVSSA
jgi:predicted nucleotidyltransferase